MLHHATVSGDVLIDALDGMTGESGVFPGHTDATAELIPAMLETFVASDRTFARMRRASIGRRPLCLLSRLEWF